MPAPAGDHSGPLSSGPRGLTGSDGEQNNFAPLHKKRRLFTTAAATVVSLNILAGNGQLPIFSDRGPVQPSVHSAELPT